MLYTYRLSALIITSFFLFASCRSGRNTPVILKSMQQEVNVEIRSSCKISRMQSSVNDSLLKKIIISNSEESLSKLKFRQKKNKADYRILKTDFVITERCGVEMPDGHPFTGLQYITTIEKIDTHEIIYFRADTVVLASGQLVKTQSLVPKPVNIEAYIPALTTKTHQRILKYFNQHKHLK